MKRFSAFLLLCAVGAAPAGAMTWSINPGNSNQIVDDTGSWTITLSNFNSTFDGVAYSGKEINGVSYTENGANGVVDLTSVEADTGLKIVSIGAHKFGVASGSNTYLKEAYLPDTIVYWGQGTFRNCTELTKVKVPTSMVRMVSDRHFGGCTSLTTVYYTGFAPVEGTVALPPCFQALSEFMFESVPMTRFYGPGVIHVERSCFPGCTLLESAEFSPNATAFMENNGNSSQGIFHNDTTYRENLKNLYPSTFCADFVTTGNSYPIPFNNATRNFKGYGWIRDTAITNYLDFSACLFTEFGEFFCYNTCIAGATIPATVTTIRNRAFNAIHNSATFRFLGPPPEFLNNNSGSQSVFYQSQQNKVGYRHTLIVDAATYPAWTNAAKFVAVADFATNNIVKNAYGWTGTDYPADFPTPDYPEETLGVATWGFEGNSGNGARYAWLVQYVDHSTSEVAWNNWDGTTLATTHVETGGYATYTGALPTRDSTAASNFVFSAWTPDTNSTVITRPTTFTATFAASLREHTITWQMDDLSTIDTTSVGYGLVPTHADASKASTAEYSYEFKGWSTDGSTVLTPIPAVTGPATYIAVFEQHDATTTATVSWFDEDGSTPLDPATTTVTKGLQPSHAEPTKTPTIDTAYTFDGWQVVGGDGTVIATANLPAVTSDVAYKAHYSAATRQYTITFADWDGSEISSTAYDYNTPAASVVVPAATPTRPATAEYSYAFAGWDAVIADVTDDATYTATYDATPIVYTATFVNGETGATISTADFAYGTAVTAPEPPDVVGFHFTDWTPSIGTMPAANTTYTANYATNRYTITWKDGITGATIETTQVYHGVTPAHADVSHSSSAKDSYAFVGWEPAIEPAVSNTTYTAVYTRTVLTPMKLALRSMEYDKDSGEITIAASVVNGESSAVTEAGVASIPLSTGETSVTDSTNIVATLSDLNNGKGYEWTVSATQTIYGVTEVAEIYGRTWARREKDWFVSESVSWIEGAYAPGSDSPSGQQVRLDATTTFPTILPRAFPDAVATHGAIVGIAAYQPNAGVAAAYYCWNGSEWVKLVGVSPAGGAAVRIFGVVDFARKSGPAVAWYADGFQLTTESGDWEVPLTSGAKLTSFTKDGDFEVSSFSSDYDTGGLGFFLIMR